MAEVFYFSRRLSTVALLFHADNHRKLRGNYLAKGEKAKSKRQREKRGKEEEKEVKSKKQKEKTQRQDQ